MHPFYDDSHSEDIDEQMSDWDWIGDMWDEIEDWAESTWDWIVDIWEWAEKEFERWDQYDEIETDGGYVVERVDHTWSGDRDPDEGLGT